MLHTIVLAYSATATNATPADLSTVMAAVPLYTSADADPLLSQVMGLTVASDTTAVVGTLVTRTLVLNMDPTAGAPHAPPFFLVQPLAEGAPLVALYSSSPADFAGSFIVQGFGAHSVTVSYTDSKGNAGVSTVFLTGKTPVVMPLAAGTVDVKTVTDMAIAATGASNTSQGQITLAVLTAPLPIGLAEPGELRDAAQILLGTPLAMMPAGFYTLAPTPALQIATLTNFFTQTLSLALAAIVIAAPPVLA